MSNINFGAKILVLPDAQVRPGVPLDFLRWAGKYAADKKVDVLVNLGDFCDMTSLSRHNTVKEQENQRLKADLDVLNAALDELHTPIERKSQALAAGHRKRWNPRLVLTLGNHEMHLDRFVQANPVLEGLVDLDTLYTSRGYEVHPFLRPVEISGIKFCHYFQQVNSGRAISGTIENMIKTIGSSFVMGHQQSLKSGVMTFPSGVIRRGLVAGSSYIHDDDYRPQANYTFRGIILLNNARNGFWQQTEIGLHWLCAKYEGMLLSKFLDKKYGTVPEWVLDFEKDL